MRAGAHANLAAAERDAGSDLAAGMDHVAFFYRDESQWVDGVADFVGQGLAASEPVVVAVPAQRHELLREHLNGDSGAIELLDMSELGRNPARIIPAVRRRLDAHPDRRLRFVGELVWPDRTAEERQEAALHEALVNVAFAGDDIRLLCPYDATALDGESMQTATRTHPHVCDGDGRRASAAYSVENPYLQCGPLQAAPRDATQVPFTVTDLAAVRRLVAERATAAGLDADRASDLVWAVSEIAANSVRHGGGTGELLLWTTDDCVICQTHDPGQIRDPLAGRVAPPVHSPNGRGLWLVNQLCDLAQIRTGSDGTTVRVRVARGPRTAPSR